VSRLVSDEYGEEVPAPMPSIENRVARRERHEGREKEAGWRTRSLQENVEGVSVSLRVSTPDSRLEGGE
jgi:hypothetical protein